MLAFASLACSADDTTPVSVVKVVRAAIAEEVKLTGTLQARRVSRLSTEVDGIVARIDVDDGDRVTAGQVILELDTDLARIEKSRSAAAVAEAAARRAEAIRRHDELLRLVEKQHVPQTNVDAARAEIAIADAALAQARAADERAQALLDRHVVRAPFDGVVKTKLVEVGQWIETNSAIAELVEVGYLRLEAPVPQFYFTRVKPGTGVAIQFDALPGQVFEATVTTTIPISETGARTFPVRIDIANESGVLAPGMSARVVVQIEPDEEPGTLIVPRDAVVRRPDGSTTVWTIVTEDGVERAHPQEIKTGRTYRNNIEVLRSELTPGERVVVRGNEILRPGQTVTVAEETPMDI